MNVLCIIKSVMQLSASGDDLFIRSARCTLIKAMACCRSLAEVMPGKKQHVLVLQTLPPVPCWVRCQGWIFPCVVNCPRCMAGRCRVPCKETRGCELGARTLWYVAVTWLVLELVVGLVQRPSLRAMRSSTLLDVYFSGLVCAH